MNPIYFPPKSKGEEHVWPNRERTKEAPVGSLVRCEHCEQWGVLVFGEYYDYWVIVRWWRLISKSRIRKIEQIHA